MLQNVNWQLYELMGTHDDCTSTFITYLFPINVIFKKILIEENPAFFNKAGFNIPSRAINYSLEVLGSREW